MDSLIERIIVQVDLSCSSGVCCEWGIPMWWRLVHMWDVSYFQLSLCEFRNLVFCNVSWLGMLLKMRHSCLETIWVFATKNHAVLPWLYSFISPYRRTVNKIWFDLSSCRFFIFFQSRFSLWLPRFEWYLPHCTLSITQWIHSEIHSFPGEWITPSRGCHFSGQYIRIHEQS